MQQKIDGKMLCDMIISGANNLINNKKNVDDLNVFPVPDGDTGTNMSLTAGAVKKELADMDAVSCSAVAEAASGASLRGARGNSGVILSQFFRGFAKGMKDVTEADCEDVARAMVMAKETAYRAVMKPAEGTILTVARQMCEGVCDKTFESVTDLVEQAVKSGNESLSKTPEMLPVLKQAGVVDAGGKGLMVLIEGAFECLKSGKIVETDENVQSGGARIAAAVSDDEIKFGYCTEFIILKNPGKSKWKQLRSKLEFIGDCVIVIDDADIIKVHVHSNNPGIVLEEALKLGQLVDIKIDNLHEQAEEHKHADEEEPAEEEITMLPHVKDAFVSVVAGDGIATMFRELGCGSVIRGGQTMNPSTDDFIREIEKIDADNIYILPNNKNIIMAAQQAKEMSAKNIEVIPTKSIVQGISSMLCFDEGADFEENVSAMTDAISEVKSGSVTFAARNCVLDGLEIKQDDIMGLVEGRINCVGSDIKEITVNTVNAMADDGTSAISLYRGEDTSEEQAEEICAALEELYPDCDVNVYVGNQPLYYYFIAVE